MADEIKQVAASGGDARRLHAGRDFKTLDASPGSRRIAPRSNSRYGRERETFIKEYARLVQFTRNTADAVTWPCHLRPERRGIPNFSLQYQTNAPIIQVPFRPVAASGANILQSGRYELGRLSAPLIMIGRTNWESSDTRHLIVKGQFGVPFDQSRDGIKSLENPCSLETQIGAAFDTEKYSFEPIAGGVQVIKAVVVIPSGFEDLVRPEFVIDMIHPGHQTPPNSVNFLLVENRFSPVGQVADIKHNEITWIGATRPHNPPQWANFSAERIDALSGFEQLIAADESHRGRIVIVSVPFQPVASKSIHSGSYGGGSIYTKRVELRSGEGGAAGSTTVGSGTTQGRSQKRYGRIQSLRGAKPTVFDLRVIGVNPKAAGDFAPDRIAQIIREAAGTD